MLHIFKQTCVMTHNFEFRALTIYSTWYFEKILGLWGNISE